MTAPVRLRRQWWVVAALACLGSVAVAAVAARTVTPRLGVAWLAAAAVPTAYTLWFLRRSLGLNHPPGDATTTDGGLYPTLGVANGVTVTRGWLYAGVAGFLLAVPPLESPWRWVPVLWYGGGAALDWVDGALARTVGRRTVLGERLDLAFDTLGFLVVPLVAVVWGQLPVWYLSVSAARYLFKFGCWLRRRRGAPVGPLPSSRLRRPLAALQMVVITGSLLPVVPPAVAWPVATVAMVPTLAVFARDYLAVAGHFGEANANTSPGH